MSVDPYRLFISYAHVDQPYRARLELHLAQPVREGRLKVWSDRMIPPGSDWDGVISEEIGTCDAVVFLVSADLLASDYIHQSEMKVAQERLNRGEIDVLAIPIFHCLIEWTWLAERQALWNPETPIGAMTERGNQEAAWVAVVRKLLKVADLAVGSRPRTTRPTVLLATPAAAVPTRFRRAVQAPHLSRGGFFGREAELSDLDAWVAGEGPLGAARVVVLRALGGMGKSALAWRWSQVHAPRVGPANGFEGVFWWSFYAPGCDVRAFVRAALAFMGISEHDMPKGLWPRLDLLAELTQERPALFVLDGFERQLRRYARSDAPDDTAAAAVLAGASRPDDCVESETDVFLGRIAAMPAASRWLMTTRVTPAMLVDLDGVRAIELHGLSREATRALFANQDVQGSDEAFAQVEAQFGGHGLTLYVYARTLKRDRVRDLDAAARHAGGFRAFWREMIGRASATADLDSEASRRLRVLMSAIDALSPQARDVLQSLTFVEAPPSVKMLQSLNSHLPGDALPRALEELRASGLLAPSDDAFVYELHPVVREAANRTVTGAGLQRAIEAFEKLGDDRACKTLHDAQRATDLFLALARAERFDAAYGVYQSRLSNWFRAEGAAARRVELLSRLCHSGFSPRLRDTYTQTGLLVHLVNALSQNLRYADEARAVEHLQRMLQESMPVSVRLEVRWLVGTSMMSVGRLAAAAQVLAEPVPKESALPSALEFEIRRAVFEGVLGRITEAETIARSVLGRVGKVDDAQSRVFTLSTICDFAWGIRDGELLAEATTALRGADDNTSLTAVIVDFHAIRSRMLSMGSLSALDWDSVAHAARDVQARLATMDLGNWRDVSARVAAMAEARTSAEAARRAAEELRDLAACEERSGGFIAASATWIEAAEAWARAGDVQAARADAIHGRNLAYCDGPPFTAKRLEDRADAIISRL